MIDVKSDTFGLVQARHSSELMIAQPSKRAGGHPHVTQLLNVWLQDRLPKGPGQAEWYWSSITLNEGYASKAHVDGNNVGPSIIRSFGSHDGGELQYWPDGPCNDPAILNPAGKESLTVFDGTKHHGTLPYNGERYSVIFYLRRGLDRASPGTFKELQALGFNPLEREVDARNWHSQVMEKGHHYEVRCPALCKAEPHLVPAPLQHPSNMTPHSPIFGNINTAK